MAHARRLLFLVTEDWYFVSHRLPLALAARAEGYAVTVATRVRKHGDTIRDAGIDVLPLDVLRHGHHPWRESRTLAQVVAIYRRVRPDLVHHVAIKPVLYGSVAAWLTRVPAVVNAIAGLGYVVSSDERRARLLRPVIETGYRLLLGRRNSRLIVQNPDDLAVLTQHRVIEPTRAVLIRGSGVDTQRYTPAPEPEGEPLVVLPARLVRDKGVVEFVDAARTLRRCGVAARFAIAGDPDPEHSARILPAQLEQWRREGAVELWGWRDDMAKVYEQCHVVCLPSYREGLPKALLEAAACARPIVTCDVPGCREVVRHEDNGLLVPPRDSEVLAQALRRLIEDRALRVRMGLRGRARAVAEFSVEAVVRDTLAVYRELMPQ